MKYVKNAFFLAMQNNKEFWYSDLSSSKKKIAIVDEHSTCQVDIDILEQGYSITINIPLYIRMSVWNI